MSCCFVVSSPASPVEQKSHEGDQAASVSKQVDGFAVSYNFTPDDLNALAAHPHFKLYLPCLRKLSNIDYPTESLFRKAVLAEVNVPVGELEPLVRLARKTHIFDPNSHIVWDGKPSDCVRDDLPGVTYGFYPYWQAGNQQTLNFSMLARVAYFGVTLNDRGEIAQRLHWQVGQAAFINEARKHGTKVDLVVYRDEWNRWRQDAEAKKLSAIETAANNIVSLVSEKLDNTYFNRHKTILTAGLGATPLMGDGVTLYFKAYPTDAASSAYLVMFIQVLKKKLHAVDARLNLNLVMPEGALGTGIFTAQYLPQLFSKETKDSRVDSVDLFLALLAEPTTHTKKQMRADIETMLHGAMRLHMLRKVVPVIMPGVSDTPAQHQLMDDIIYFKDSYGGVGFWPLPMMTGKVTDKVAEMEIAGLTKFYLSDRKSRSLLSKFICK